MTFPGRPPLRRFGPDLAVVFLEELRGNPASVRSLHERLGVDPVDPPEPAGSPVNRSTHQKPDLEPALLARLRDYYRDSDRARAEPELRLHPVDPRHARVGDEGDRPVSRDEPAAPGEGVALDMHAARREHGAVDVPRTRVGDLLVHRLPVLVQPTERILVPGQRALAAAPAAEAFMTAASPGVVSMFLGNVHYKSEEEFLWAVANAMT